MDDAMLDDSLHDGFAGVPCPRRESRGDAYGSMDAYHLGSGCSDSSRQGFVCGIHPLEYGNSELGHSAFGK